MSSTELHATAPSASAAKTLDVTVTADNLTSRANLADLFSYDRTTSSCPTGVTHLAAGQPWAVASMVTSIDGQVCSGYWVVTRSGGVTAIGAARWLGDMSTHQLNAPMIAIAATPDHGGYYLLGSDGGVFAFSNTRFHGSTGSMHLNAPVMGMAVSPIDGGYWLAATDGGIFTFGDTTYYGSTGNLRLNAPMVGISADDHTGGYWLVAADGGVFGFDAHTLDGPRPCA